VSKSALKNTTKQVPCHRSYALSLPETHHPPHHRKGHPVRRGCGPLCGKGRQRRHSLQPRRARVRLRPGAH
jgi:hypothetical protein